MKFLKYPFVIVLLSGFLFTSCKDNEDDVNPVPAQGQVSFYFDHSVGSQPINYNSIQYTNATGNDYSVATLKYFISDITLHRADETFELIDEAHYVDGLDENTLTFVPDGMVPTGEYTGISFIFGLDEEKNVNGAFPNPPENNMEWPPAMGTGYHYMKLEGKIDSAGTIKNYQCHTGPTMNNQNYIEVTLENSSIIVDSQGTLVTIRMNINNWWVSPHTLDLNDMSMIMGNQEMQVMLQENGEEDVFSILSIE